MYLYRGIYIVSSIDAAYLIQTMLFLGSDCLLAFKGSLLFIMGMYIIMVIK
jgi:hypothetical protein